MLTDKDIAQLRTLRGCGMISAVGEYTPDELWLALDSIELVRGLLRRVQAVNWASDSPLLSGELAAEIDAALGPNEY